MLPAQKFDKLVRSVPFLACLSQPELEHLKNLIIEKRFSKHEVILHEEDTANYIYFIYSGKVKVVQLSAEGDERIIAFHKKGDYFGEMAILDGKTAPATVVALEDAEIGFLSRPDFEMHFLKNPQVLHQIVLMLCERLRESWQRLKLISFADAEQRMRAVLKNICDQFGVADTRGTILNLKLTHKDFAHLAGTSRETATRILNGFERAGEIETLDSKYMLVKPLFMEKLPTL